MSCGKGVEGRIFVLVIVLFFVSHFGFRLAVREEDEDEE